MNIGLSTFCSQLLLWWPPCPPLYSLIHLIIFCISYFLFLFFFGNKKWAMSRIILLNNYLCNHKEKPNQLLFIRNQTNGFMYFFYFTPPIRVELEIQKSQVWQLLYLRKEWKEIYAIHFSELVPLHEILEQAINTTLKPHSQATSGLNS